MVWEDQGLYFTLILNSIVLVVCVIVGKVIHKKEANHRVMRPNLPESKTGTFYGFPKSLFHLNEDELGEMVGIEGAIYCLLMKISAAFCLACVIGTIIIVPMCATDDYLNVFAWNQDPLECRDQATVGDCDDKPYCEWANYTTATFTQTTPFCQPKPRSGLFDWGLQNLTPNQWKLYLYGVAVFLTCIQCLIVMHFALAALKSLFMKAYVNPIYGKVKHSALGSVGARTVLVQGFDKESELLNDPAALVKSLQEATLDPKEKDGERPVDPSAEFAAFIVPDTCVVVREAPSKLVGLMADEADALETLKGDVIAHKKEEKEDKKPKLLKAIEKDEKELNKIRDKLREELPKRPEQDFIGSFFISFDTPIHAFQFCDAYNTAHGGFVSSANAYVCGHRDFVTWGNLAVSGCGANIRWVLMIILLFILTFFWGIPVGFLGSLENIATLPGIGPPFASLVNAIPVTILGILSAYLPTIVLTIFNIVLPMIIRFFSRIGGAQTLSNEDSSALVLFFFFTLMCGIIIQAALQGGLGQLTALLGNPNQDSVSAFIIAIVSPSGGYWYSFLITAACMGHGLKILLLGPLIVSKLFLKLGLVGDQKGYDALFAPRVFDIPISLARHLFFFAIAMLFYGTVPFLVPFGALYFVVGYLVERGCIMDGGAGQPKLGINFGLAKGYMGILVNLHTVATVGCVLVASLKEHIGAIVFCALGLVLSVVMQVYMRTTMNPLVYPTLPLVMELTNGGDPAVVGELEPLDVNKHGYMPDYAFYEIDEEAVDKIKNDPYEIDETWYEKEGREKPVNENEPTSGGRSPSDGQSVKTVQEDQPARAVDEHHGDDANPLNGDDAAVNKDEGAYSRRDPEEGN